MSVPPTPVRASLAPAARRPPAPAARPLLAPAGAAVVLGARPAADGLAAPIVPAAHTLFGPRGACLAGPRGPLVVCDTGHHRLLVWRERPTADHQPADLLVGQPSFAAEGRNGHREVGPATLDVPTGVAFADGVLAVADAWNHRVLLWWGVPEASHRPADVVLGQADFSGRLANRGSDRPTAATLHWCSGVALVAGRLLVADTGNRRVLVWDRVPTTSGAPADLVLGQAGFVTRDEGGGAGAGPTGMRWPHAVAVRGEALWVADAGSSRVMGWRRFPTRDGQACELALGQADLEGTEPNRGRALPGEDTLHMPYGVTELAGQLVVADTASSRLLGFEGQGPGAQRLAGQAGFGDRGDNRWGVTGRDTLCWPYAVAASGTTLVVADTGNNRVLLWEAA